MFIYPKAIANPMDVFLPNSVRMSVDPIVIDSCAVNIPQVVRPTKVEIPLTCKFVDCN